MDKAMPFPKDPTTSVVAGSVSVIIEISDVIRFV